MPIQGDNGCTSMRWLPLPISLPSQDGWLRTCSPQAWQVEGEEGPCGWGVTRSKALDWVLCILEKSRGWRDLARCPSWDFDSLHISLYLMFCSSVRALSMSFTVTGALARRLEVIGSSLQLASQATERHKSNKSSKS